MATLNELITHWEEEENTKKSEISDIKEALIKLASLLEKEGEIISKFADSLKQAPILKKEGEKIANESLKSYLDSLSDEMKAVLPYVGGGIVGLGMLINEKLGIWPFKRKKKPSLLAKALPYLGVATSAGGLGYLLGYKAEQKKLSPYEKDVLRQLATMYYLAGREEAKAKKKAASFLRKLADVLEDLYEKKNKVSIEAPPIMSKVSEENGIRVADLEVKPGSAEEDFIREILNM